MTLVKLTRYRNGGTDVDSTIIVNLDLIATIARDDEDTHTVLTAVSASGPVRAIVVTETPGDIVDMVAGQRLVADAEAGD